MKNLKKQLSAIALCTVFAAMQVPAVGEGVGLINADLNYATGGYAGLDPTSTTGNATLNFTGNSHLMFHVGLSSITRSTRPRSLQHVQVREEYCIHR